MADIAVTTEVMLAGSLISVQNEDGSTARQGLYPSLPFEIDERLFEDETAQIVIRAVKRCYAPPWSAEPTAEQLATIALADAKSVMPTVPVPGNVEEMASLRARMIDKFSQYAAVGATSKAGLQSLLSFLRLETENRNLGKAEQKIKGIVGDSTLTPGDKYSAIMSAVEESKPKAVEARVYDTEAQVAYMKKMVAEQRARIGQKQMTFPPEWGLSDYIPYLLPGLLYTVAGLTGRGKSALLQQIAIWLARCGFKVAFFHLEDSIDRQLEHAARRLTGASPAELRTGDPRGMYNVLAKTLRAIKKNSGGELIFLHCPGAGATYIREQTLSLKPDIVIVDYLQKMDIQYEISATKGNRASAFSLVVEELKQLAENNLNRSGSEEEKLTALIMGSQEAEWQMGQRTGTGETRDAERKAQAVLVFERLVLADTDVPEKVNGVDIALSGQLSGFGRIYVEKNNDGMTGYSVGVFNGLTLEFFSLGAMEWARKHPGETMPVPVLVLPDEQYLGRWDAKREAWSKLDQYFNDPWQRRKDKGNTKSGPVSSDDDDAFDEEFTGKPPF